MELTEEKMKKTLLILACFAVVLLVPLGFNTIEYMCHYAPPEKWCFIWPWQFCMPFWYAYMLGGIIPFASGFFFAGIIVGIVAYSELLKRKK